ncbi:hypothetical protein [Streptomyces niveus]|uniref:hypothetical protein n=1 Tax=Streptomyces niveus TaxID=193462 RepID=UPI0035D8628D
MDDRWSGMGATGGPAGASGPAGAGQAPGPGFGPPGSGPGFGQPGFGPPHPFAPPEPPGRAPRRHTGAYITSGVLLIGFACVLGAWIVHAASNATVDVDWLLESLVKNDPTLPLMVFTAHEWAFTLALLVVGIATLTLRRTARGAALLLAFLLLGVGARQINGLTRSDYRDHMFATEHGTLILLTYMFAFLAAITVIILMLVARERDVPPEPASGGRRAAGVLLILIGAVQGYWYARGMRQLNQYIGDENGGRGAFTEWWREVLNVNALGGYGISAGFAYYPSVLIAAFLVVGVLLLCNAPAARGAALALLGIAGYLQLRDLAGIEYGRLADHYRDSITGWSLTCSFAVGAAMLVAVVLVRRTARPYVPPRYPPSPLP